MEEELEALYLAAKKEVALLRSKLETAALRAQNDLEATAKCDYGSQPMQAAGKALEDIRKALTAPEDNRVANAYRIACDALYEMSRGSQP